MTAEVSDREPPGLRELFQQAPAAMAVLRGPTHVFELANPAYYALVGVRDVLGKSVASALPEVTEQGFVELLDEVYRSGVAYVGRATPVTLRQRADGAVEHRMLDFVYQPLRQDTGEVTGIFVQATDVTDRVLAELAFERQRKDAEAVQRESQQMTALALRGGRMGTWVRDLAAGTVQWSPDLEALFGLPAGSFGGSESAFFDLVHPDDRDTVTNAVTHAIEARTDYRVEFRFRHASGEWRWMEGRGRAVYADPDVPVRLHGVGIDVTDRKQIETELAHKREALSQSETRFRQLIEAAPVGVALSEPDGSVMLVNDTLLAILGYSRSDIEQRPLDWQRFTAPEHLSRDIAYMEALRRGVSPPPFEKDLIRADGSRVPVLIAARFLPGEGERMVAYALDITEVREAEAALRRTEQRLSRLFETNLLGVLYFDLDGGVQDANDEFLRIVGYTREELARGAVDWSRMTPEEFKDQDVRAVAHLRQTGAHAPMEKQYIRKDGSRVWVLVGSALFDHRNGVGFLLDLSGLRSAEQALRNANRRKDEFLATLAHELRNPLAPIRNAVHLMKHVQPMDSQLKSVRDIIDRQVRHMVRLVDDLLDVSRITLGQVSLRSEIASLGGVITDAIEAARPLIEASEHSLTVQLPAENMQIEGDATRLSQVFQNLLNNAAKYTPTGGRIALEVERDREAAVIRVRDNGIGIPPDLHERVFELFTRAHPSDEMKTSGLGIGLALARQLVELHGGDISVRSAGRDKGSEFIVRLPLLPMQALSQVTPAASAENVPLAQRRVLIVDDNRDAAESLAMLLQLAGCVVDVAFDGAGALTALPRFRPDIVLLDIGMPGMDGYATAQHMRAMPEGKDVLLVALTGWGQEEDKRRARAAGFDEHLTKPIDPSVLNTVLTLDRVDLAGSTQQP